MARIYLNKALNSLIPSIQETVSRAYEIEVPPCKEDWISLSPYNLLAQIFARIATRVMVGPELGAEGGRWLTLAREYITAVCKAPGIVRHKYNPWLRWVAKYREPEVKNVLRLGREGADILKPVLDARRAELLQGDKKKKAGEQHDDAIQWFLEEYNALGKELTPDTLARGIYVIMTAAVDSTSSTALWMFFDLVEHPEALAEIREEIEKVTDGQDVRTFNWTRQTLGELKVLDSFMRESFRVHSLTHSKLNIHLSLPLHKETEKVC